MTAVLLWPAFLAAGALSSPAAPAAPAAPEGEAVCATTAVSARSVWAPPGPRELTRVLVVARPFLGLVGNTWGAISEGRIEHYFAQPFMVGIDIAPVAIAVDSNRGAGAITHLRLHAAYVTDFLAIGFGVGERLRRFGSSGVSLAPSLRLGALDGLNLSLTFGYVVARNPYSGRPSLGFSNVAGALSVPLTERLAATLDVGFSLDIWAFGSLGLRQRLTGDGGPGSWFVGGAFGLAAVSDRTVCHFEAEIPCSGSSALSFGPTVSVALERRF